ncbi:redoxin family protein [Alkalitalea saponilacus]|uniref:Thiol-disulfide isomerase or thioredoxin n=1 Tax=Alkalitalea saponilacus TaxID=889453 RepID=A0A1T5AJ29_9BACT|nr:redoxin family protein [Alkalitalea saponilacus]ASB48681.1 redoxin [Alkalitalea saponilacus]SKB35011.1 Thiol-disulfide isomerase or thioredoxin [Alkalitalea saponilacus]
MKINIILRNCAITIMAFSAIQSCKVPSRDGELFEPNPIVLERMEVKTLETGSKMPPFELPDMYGQMVSHEQFSDAEVLVVAFISNHCPTSQAYEDRIIRFVEDYEDKGVTLVAINPNSPFGLLPEECSYSDLDDTFETMSIRAEHKGYNFTYLYDGDNHAVSLLFGPVSTPHFFVFDSERILRYNGRMDEIERPGTANGEDLRKAVDQVLAGEEVSNPRTSAFGCSVKWSWLDEWVSRINREWREQEITIDFIDKNGVEEIMANDTENLRLVNVWASWCGPCVQELPDLLEINRYYRNRRFEMVMISADSPDKKDDALRILRNNHMAVSNFIFNDTKRDDLIYAIDPDWRGAIPYTLLIEPGGNIIYKHQGVINDLELKRIIVEHPLLGRYY